jgi:uncharacterized protein YciI
MPFAIQTTDKADHEGLRLEVRAEHLTYLESQKGILLAAGATLSDDGQHATGGLLVVDVEDRKAAETFINNDPFTKAGLFQSIKITRWRKAFFNFQNTL